MENSISIYSIQKFKEMISQLAVESLEEKGFNFDKYLKGCRECGCTYSDLNYDDFKHLFFIISTACYNKGLNDGQQME